MTEQRDPNRYDGPRQRLQALIEASLALGESRDLFTLLRRILDLATTHVGAERGTLFHLNAGDGHLIATVFHGDDVEQIVLPGGQGIAGQVAETGQPVRLADAYEDPRFDRSVDQRTGYQTRSLLAVPMRLRTGEIVGVVEVLNKRDDGIFDEDDEAFLDAFGAQAAVALETARLTEVRIRGERLEAIGTISANLVHDLKNPLSGIHSYTDVILQQPPPELLERCVSGIRRQTARMDHMVGSILRFVRGEDALLVSRMDFDELLDEIVQDLQAAHRGDAVEIERTGERVGNVRVDGMALRRVVDNLSRNAAEAMPDGGRIRIDARIQDEHIGLTIRDDGPGMDPDRIADLFKPWTTEGKRTGTGLGLAIVRRIVDRHGGTIEVESEPGTGTTFRIQLPVAGPAEDDPVKDSPVGDGGGTD